MDKKAFLKINDVVKVVGIVGENNLEKATWEGDDVIRGSLNVIVDLKVANEDVTLNVPVNFFVKKHTNAGTVNVAYTNLETAYNDIRSAAVVGKENATCVAINNGRIFMNEYYNKNGNLVSFPKVNASFINIIDRSKMKPEASFKVIMVVGNERLDEVDADGIETGRYLLKGVVEQWGGKYDIVPFVVTNPNAIEYIREHWEPNSTIEANGRLNFTVTTREVTKEAAFGEPTVETYTNTISELVITAGYPPIDEDDGRHMDLAEVSAGLKARTADLEEKKKKASEKDGTQKKTEYTNLGF